MAENNRTAVSVGHEERDVNALAITASGAAVLALVVAVVFAMGLLFNLLSQRASQRAPAPELAREQTPPPEPRVEGNPVAAYQEIRRGEEQLLNSYAWIDPDQGVVRIPVNRALERIARRGVPAAAPGGTQ
jgi:hypothetical protein